ncbi:hypothetical protein DFH28DRAFT_911363 [Melampsora americana]|nr:hypothetical protein DFH28DRAFT_911363 [Melampsora americana]
MCHSARQTVKINFCKCTSDNVRLVEMGFIGATPVHPRTAFSIRLLRTHHVYWKHMTTPTQGFALALDELLDDFNPLIEVKGTGRPRDWRTPLGVAIDAYRDILKQIRQLEFEKMQLDALGQLAANCPRCFGPPVGVTQPEEPDIVVCQDGNFQQKRHATASVPIPGYDPPVPELFIPPSEVHEMANELTRLTNRNTIGAADEDHEHPCTESHKAADDMRSSNHFKGYEQTGLFVMGCRHDHALRFIDIVQSGEKSYFALTMMKWIYKTLALRNHTNKVAFLYDIGCNTEKGIINRALGRLKMATSVFHAYAHDWGCQLDYNPRLNKGWGLSDGEGSERIWQSIMSLVSGNRYATNEHRQININLRTIHHNTILKNNAVSSMTDKGLEARRRLQEADKCLTRLSSIDPQYTSNYFESQWERQRNLQKSVINERVQQKQDRLKILLRLEEDLYETRCVSVRTRTQAERRAVLSLPGQITTMETKIQAFALELGTTEFLQVTGSTGK